MRKISSLQPMFGWIWWVSVKSYCRGKDLRDKLTPFKLWNIHIDMYLLVCKTSFILFPKWNLEQYSETTLIITCMNRSRHLGIQRISKRLFPGSVILNGTFVVCFPTAGWIPQFFHPVFTQPGKSLLEIPCSVSFHTNTHYNFFWFIQIDNRKKSLVYGVLQQEVTYVEN